MSEYTFENEAFRKTYWHTCSHIMAQAIKRKFPQAKLAIGPSIKDGFYYDFDIEGGFNDEDLEKLEGESYLMEVTDVGNGNFAVGNEVVVNSSMLSNFQIGDMLNIQFDGKVTMSIPPQVVNVLGVTFIRSTK